MNIYVKAGQDGLVLKIPWSATGPHPCNTCLALDGTLFDPESFPGPPHFYCLCNAPMADPVLVF